MYEQVEALLLLRGRLVLPRHWAHELGVPERGCLLVARRPDMGPLHTQSVVLLLEHGAPCGPPFTACLLWMEHALCASQ